MIGIYMVMTMIMTCSWPKLKGSRSGKEDDYDCCWPRLRGLRSGDYDYYDYCWMMLAVLIMVKRLEIR